MKKVTLYVGLNDKTTLHQEIGTIDAYKIAQNILAANHGGSTIHEGMGSYRMQESGALVKENSLVCILFGVDDEKALDKSIRELKNALNQESIGVEITESNFDYR